MDALTHLEMNGRMDLRVCEMLPKHAMLWSCEWEITCYSSSRSLHALTSPESPRSVRHQQVWQCDPNVCSLLTRTRTSIIREFFAMDWILQLWEAFSHKRIELSFPVHLLVFFSQQPRLWTLMGTRALDKTKRPYLGHVPNRFCVFTRKVVILAVVEMNMLP